MEENDDDVPSYPSMSVPGFESLFRAPLLRRASELLGAIDDESAASSLPPTKQLNGEQPISDLVRKVETCVSCRLEMLIFSFFSPQSPAEKFGQLSLLLDSLQ